MNRKEIKKASVAVLRSHELSKKIKTKNGEYLTQRRKDSAN